MEKPDAKRPAFSGPKSFYFSPLTIPPACAILIKLPTRGLKVYRGVEQLVARRAHNPEVVGSNPSPATKTKETLCASLFVLPVERLKQRPPEEVVGKAGLRCRWQMKQLRFFRSGRKTQGSA